MASRLELQSLLEELLGSRNVYYQPPESTKMSYDAIKFSRVGVQTMKANDVTYFGKNRYELIVISKKPNNPVIEKLLSIPYCSFERYYKADNLHHDVLTLYY